MLESNINEQNKNLIMFKTFTKDNISIGNGYMHSWDISDLIKVDGYVPLYIANVSMENATSDGSQSSYCNCYMANLNLVNVRNFYSGSAKIKITIIVAYSKEDLFIN